MITMRDVRSDDKEMIRNWRNLPDVSKYMYTDHYVTLEEHEKWFKEMLVDHTRRYWIIRYNEEDVGLVYLTNIDNRNKRCYFSFYVASPNLRGKGIGRLVEYLSLRYIFEELKFNKVCIEVLAFNKPVIDLHKSLGCIEEGYFRKHVFKAGTFMDVVCLSMLREEWELNRSQIEEKLRGKGLI